jgi:hypothetical protein
MTEITDWFQSNLLTLNYSKTTFLQFLTKKNKEITIQLTASNSIITNINSTKFLGLIIKSTLSWSMFCRDTRAHWSHHTLLWYSGTIVQLHGKWRSLVSNKQAYVSQQLAYLGNDVILRLSLCVGVRAVIYFSRSPTVRKYNCRRLSAELEDSIVLPLTCPTVCALPLTP